MSGDGGNRRSGSSAWSSRRRSPTVAPAGTSIARRSRPNASAYDAKNSVVIVIVLLLREGVGLARPLQKTGSAPWPIEEPGTRQRRNPLSRFPFACLCFLGFEGFDAGHHRPQLL